MSTLFEKVTELNNTILRGKVMEAFERFYHQDVSMQENEQPATLGKDANRKREEDFAEALIEFRAARVLKVAVGENVSMVEWHFDYTHKDLGVRNYTQISVQEWKDGQIIKEKFYYGA